jgi:hypothetical protein
LYSGKGYSNTSYRWERWTKDAIQHQNSVRCFSIPRATYSCQLKK